VLADVMARVLLAPQELPVGVLTAVLGGGYLLWRVYRDADTGARCMSAALQTLQLSAELGGRKSSKPLTCRSPGRWTCVVGPNGAGKSSLLKALAGLLPHSGQVLWQGQPLASLTRQQRGFATVLAGPGRSQHARLARVGRGHARPLATPKLAGYTLPQDAQMVEAALKATQAWDWRERTLGELSGGERQRVLLARAMAGNAPTMLMDEPLANLDPPHQVDWLEQVHCLLAQGTTVVSVLHEIGMALHADDIVVMREGQVVHHGAGKMPPRTRPSNPCLTTASASMRWMVNGWFCRAMA
jgi:iron complex transport system ATP-binding protein